MDINGFLKYVVGDEILEYIADRWKNTPDSAKIVLNLGKDKAVTLDLIRVWMNQFFRDKFGIDILQLSCRLFDMAGTIYPTVEKLCRLQSQQAHGK